MVDDDEKDGNANTSRQLCVKDSSPLPGAFSILIAAEKARERCIPLFAAQIDLKKRSTMWTETKH